MKVIWKYPLEITEEQTIEVPKKYEVLCIQTQDNEPFLWVLVEEDDYLIILKIITLETGEDAHRVNLKDYIGTYQVDDGSFVGHVFIMP